MRSSANCSVVVDVLGAKGQLSENLTVLCISNSTSMDNGVQLSPTDSLPASRIVFCAILFIIIFLTIVGNFVVLLAFLTDRPPYNNNQFNYYIMNLALTDLLVGCLAMTFYTVDVLLGYWPFGQFMCGVWIFFDYGMTFASVFTLVAISGDRYWSVAWALHYRKHNSRRKTLYTILVTWFAVLVVWLGPCIVDRYRWSEPNFCKWEPSKNRAFVVFIAIVGHHSPCIILVFCYIRVAIAMISQQKAVRRMRVGPNSSAMAPSGKAENDTSTTTSSGAAKTTTAANQKSASDDNNKEKKIFITLSYVIISYLACWVPFHVVFDISALKPSLVPEPVYTTTFWLTYFNSTLNPFLYAYSSKEFRTAFKNVLKCQFLFAPRN